VGKESLWEFFYKGLREDQSGGNSFGARKNPQSTLEQGIQVKGAALMCIS